MNPRVRLALSMLFAAAVTGCDNDTPGRGAAPSPPPSAVPAVAAVTPSGPYRVVAVERGGAIAGTCRLEGRPTPAPLHAWPGMGVEEGQRDESVAVGAGQELGGCVVSIESIASGKDWPETQRSPDRGFLLTIASGRYEPHIALIRGGTQISVTNRLAGNINVHGFLGRETAFNFSADPGRTYLNIADLYLERPGVYHVTDDIRGAFTAWIHVLANPYADWTTAEPRPNRAAGAYRLDDVPAGDYDLQCWHEPMDRRDLVRDGTPTRGSTLGPPIEIRRRVHVKRGETTTADFTVVVEPK